MYKRSPGKFIGMVVLGIIALTLFPAIIMLLWNWLVPTLFSGPIVSYWQALGLFVLAKILFSGGHCGRSRDHHNHDRRWKSHLREKIELKHIQNTATEEPSPSDTVDTNPGNG